MLRVSLTTPPSQPTPYSRLGLRTLATLVKTVDFTLFYPSSFENRFPTREGKDRKDRWPIFRLSACPYIHMQRFRAVALIQNSHLWQCVSIEKKKRFFFLCVFSQTNQNKFEEPMLPDFPNL